MTASPDWTLLFRRQGGPGINGLDGLRVWWLLQELHAAGLDLRRGDGDRITVTRARKDARALDDYLRGAIRSCRPALLAYIDARDARHHTAEAKEGKAD